MTNSASLFVRFLLASMLAGSLMACASRPGPNVLQTVKTAPVAGAEQVKVYAVTTRNRVRPGSNIFDASKATAANYAELTVSIPPGHKPSQIEWPKGKKPNPATEFAVTEQAALDQAVFADRINPARHASPKVGVFVHGYNYNFQEALFRLAQISADSKMAGMPILFSWPSQGAISGYVADKESATYSRDYLAGLMKELARNRGPGDVYIFGHSMGGWLVVEALRQLRLEGRDDVLDKLVVVLAAPDIDSDVFRTQMAVIGKMKHPMTILVANDDRALAVSQFISASTNRVGRLNINDPKVQTTAVANGVVLIDISQIKSTDSANHSRFVDAVALYPALTAEANRNTLGHAGAFVFDAAAATISSPFRLVSGALKQ